MILWKENWMFCSEMRQQNQIVQNVSIRWRYLLASNRYCIKSKTVATPNWSPFAEGSADYTNTSVPNKILKHRCVEPHNTSANSEKICKPKCKPKDIRNKPFRRKASGGLRRTTANMNKKFNLDQDHDMKCSGAVRLEIELILVEVHTVVKSMWNQGA